MTKTTVYLPAELKESLKRAAAASGRTEAEVIREGIRLAVAATTRPKPRSGIFSSGRGDLSLRVDEILAEGFGRD